MMPPGEKPANGVFEVVTPNRRLVMNKDKVKTFADKVYGDMAGAMGVGMAYIGVKTGLFRAMQGRGAMQAGEVTAATGLQPRYVEEWLKGMTACGYLEYDSGGDRYL